jgi:hypothetical protein
MNKKFSDAAVEAAIKAYQLEKGCWWTTWSILHGAYAIGHKTSRGTGFVYAAGDGESNEAIDMKMAEMRDKAAMRAALEAAAGVE